MPSGIDVQSVSSRKPPMARRKVRRGTSSCWECKRRKIRCHFESPSHTICSSCEKRGCECVPQHIVPDTAETSENGNEVEIDPRYREMGEKISRMEDLVTKLVRRPPSSAEHSRSHSTRLGKKSQGKVPPRLIAPRTGLVTEYTSLIGQLQSYFPPATTVTWIFHRSIFSRLHILMALQPRDTPVTPSLTPVTLARNLIQLAVCLQELGSVPQPDKAVQATSLGLKAPVVETASSYLQTVTQRVMCHERLVYSIEGVEALMLACLYYVSVGKFRLAWTAVRRAVRIAATLGSLVGSLWVQIVYKDSFLSLVLGLPPWTPEKHAAFFAISESQTDPDDPAQILGRYHTSVMNRIAERNEQRGTSTSNIYDEETKAIDCELRLAARSVPTKWWIVPSNTELETPEETQRLILQTHHYYLVVLAHFPFIISDSDPTNLFQSGTQHSEDQHVYNKLTALTAGHSLLSRFVLQRAFAHVSSWCHAIGIKAITAAFGILLAHIDGHRFDQDNILEHRRPDDLNVVEQVVTYLKEFTNGIEAQTRVLLQLVEIEASAAESVNYKIIFDQNMMGPKQNANGALENALVCQGHVRTLLELDEPSDGLHFLLPGFGVVIIERLGFRQHPRDLQLEADVSESFQMWSLPATIDDMSWLPSWSGEVDEVLQFSSTSFEGNTAHLQAEEQLLADQSQFDEPAKSRTMTYSSGRISEEVDSTWLNLQPE